MSTHHPQLRPLAPKLPVQHRLQLEYNSIGDEQDTEVPATHTANVQLQPPETFILLSPLASADDGFPLSGAPVVTSESHNLS